MRLFLSINFNEEIKNSLCLYMQKLKAASSKGKFTNRDNLHLTLAFIGDTSNVSAIRRAMGTVEERSFAIRTGGLGLFQRDGSSVCWLGLQENKTLDAVYRKLCAELRAAGFPLENREYRPHLTLGRQVVFPSGFDREAFSRDHLPALTATVSKISLMKSERRGGRLTYTEIYGRSLPDEAGE